MFRILATYEPSSYPVRPSPGCPCTIQPSLFCGIKGSGSGRDLIRQALAVHQLTKHQKNFASRRNRRVPEASEPLFPFWSDHWCCPRVPINDVLSSSYMAFQGKSNRMKPLAGRVKVGSSKLKNCSICFLCICWLAEQKTSLSASKTHEHKCRHEKPGAKHEWTFSILLSILLMQMSVRPKSGYSMQSPANPKLLAYM